ncbi:DUF2752 domain-containing protein [Alloprevotella sp. OH1205_COT-284]|uniref:DUF2752 domain-containing protein n=1 Tax=Alloprevotella sp. OH1205_COT-284 TaxID=2491043 RepID=UPI000F5E1627|nr:DUF2752 domain-containing protein [Alloprevotella sp. OH1205_COT-284]RRD80152.1 DUF2752 domain-containing protein [Alloprevotella sp. OH1205_COT-284]
MDNRKKRHILLPVAVLVAGSLYYLYDPELGAWFPQCHLRTWTGYSCPTCGAQRALHDLLHGHVAEAVAHNLLLPVAVVLLLLYVGSGRWERLAPLRKMLQSRVALVLYGVCVLLWWVLRNILRI